MIDYDTNSRIQAARDHADRLADEIRRTRPVNPDEPGHGGRVRLVAALGARVERLRRRGHAPAYQA